MNIKEIFKRDRVKGKQVLGRGWGVLFLVLVLLLSILGVIALWVS